MKSFKLLFMLAGLSSVVSASDLPNDSFFTKATEVISKNVDKATVAARALAQTISDKASTYLASTPEVVSTPVVEAAAEVVTASPVTESYMAQLYSTLSDLSSSAVKNTSELGSSVVKNTTEFGASVVKSGSELSSAAVKSTTDLANTVAKNASDFGTSVSTKASDLTAYVVKSGSELGATVAKNASEFGTTVSTKTSEMTTASVKFVEENQTAVIISATVASALAITAIVRYNMYGYVFYKSAEADDKN